MIATDHGERRRQYVPCGGRLDLKARVRRGGDAAGQGAGQPLGEVARRVAGQVAEQVAPHIAADRHEGTRRRPPADPPHQIVGRDQHAEQAEGAPYGAAALPRPGRDDVDQRLHAVLRRHRRQDGERHRYADHGMLDRVAGDIVQQEADRPLPERQRRLGRPPARTGKLPGRRKGETSSWTWWANTLGSGGCNLPTHCGPNGAGPRSFAAIPAARETVIGGLPHVPRMPELRPYFATLPRYLGVIRNRTRNPRPTDPLVDCTEGTIDAYSPKSLRCSRPCRQSCTAAPSGSSPP